MWVISAVQHKSAIYLFSMLGKIFGKSEKQEKKVEADISVAFNTKLKGQFCEVCEKNPATKVAFGQEVKPRFTCATCEITAVGGSVQRLTPKNLMTSDKLADELAKELIAYQSSQKIVPMEHKKMKETCEGVRGKAGELQQKIVEEYKQLKAGVQKKHESILDESSKQNTVLIFEEANKLVKQKNSNPEQIKAIVRRSMVNSKGLAFTDEEAIESVNSTLAERFTSLKKESKLKVKNLEDLIDEINAITF